MRKGWTLTLNASKFLVSQWKRKHAVGCTQLYNQLRQSDARAWLVHNTAFSAFMSDFCYTAPAKMLVFFLHIQACQKRLCLLINCSIGPSDKSLINYRAWVNLLTYLSVFTFFGKCFLQWRSVHRPSCDWSRSVFSFVSFCPYYNNDRISWRKNLPIKNALRYIE